MSTLTSSRSCALPNNPVGSTTVKISCVENLLRRIHLATSDISSTLFSFCSFHFSTASRISFSGATNVVRDISLTTYSSGSSRKDGDFSIVGAWPSIKEIHFSSTSMSCKLFWSLNTYSGRTLSISIFSTACFPSLDFKESKCR